MRQGLPSTGHQPPELMKYPELDQGLRRLDLNERGSAVDARKLEYSARRAAASEEYRKQSHRTQSYPPPDLPWGLPDPYRPTGATINGELFAPSHYVTPPGRIPAPQCSSSYFVPHPRLPAGHLPSYSNIPRQTYFPTPLPPPLPIDPLSYYPAVPSHYPNQLPVDPPFGDVMQEGIFKPLCFSWFLFSSCL